MSSIQGTNIQRPVPYTQKRRERIKQRTDGREEKTSRISHEAPPFTNTGVNLWLNRTGYDPL